MPKKPSARPAPLAAFAKGGELHQTASSRSKAAVLTTNQGIPLSDNQNSLRIGARGPTLIEDFVLREKVTHFDHERIPERIVHARGSGAHGYFELYKSLKAHTRADFLQRAGEKTRVFARFSTVAGGAGSGDMARDVRGFAVKFYTNEGNFDLVGNNIPVFFIQDAIKFPDLVHSVKMEPDRGFPQAGSAHDTFWDFVSLMPETMHMIMWAMSDRAIPRSLRMMEGFGVHTFRLVDAAGKSRFVKFHWRPKLGMQSVVWDEAVKINGADPDFHRRDLWTAIEEGNFPEWELGLQVFSEAQADKLDFDVLDPTKLIPEEQIPLQMVGRLVLNRNPDNFFAETEQIAFCPANIVPGIDFSDDPLLQGRLFSYLDTQLKRLGGPNSHEIPINRPICPMHNFQRDGHMRQEVAKGRVNYEPNSLAPESPRESPERGFTTFPRTKEGAAVRLRAESFADHFSQARMFYRSQAAPEQDHIAAALVFELSKVETAAIRQRVLSQLLHVDRDLAGRVAKSMRAPLPDPAPTRVKPKEIPLSPALSIHAKMLETLQGRTVACLVADGSDRAQIEGLRSAIEAEGAAFKVVAPSIGGAKAADGSTIAVDFQLPGAPSVLFDAVVLAISSKGARELAGESAAVGFVADAYAHLKVIGFVPNAKTLMLAAGVTEDKHDDGVVAVATKAGAKAFVAAARRLRIWAREPGVRNLP